ncbi:MAG: hypothetical protein E7615_01905 [Ruminococcaceae bacterium]|nr:hypothetical protein [Oscillospiraceae bacterium]
MKRLLLTALILCVAVAVLAGCGDSSSDTKETGDSTENTNQAAEQTAEQTAEETTPTLNVDFTKFDSYKVFEAPEDNPRDIAYNYMYKMSQIKWVASETWNTHWKNPLDYVVDITYTKGKTYYGLPYADTKCGYDVFAEYVVDGKFTPNSDFYEELLGNHCSSSMTVAYQQLVDLPYTSSLKEADYNKGLIKLAGDLKLPDKSPYLSKDVLDLNGIDKIYEAYTTLDKGDILFKCVEGSGHIRMVSKVEISKTVAGKLNPARSYVYCLEQTNAWADNKRNSTWFVDRKYSFTELNDTLFTPFTLAIFHEENPVIEDHYIAMKGKNTPESVVKLLAGSLESNSPINYVRATVTDKDGKIVGEVLKYNNPNVYKANIREMSFSLGIDKLPAGTYTFTLKAGIARGTWEIENFEFTKE